MGSLLFIPHHYPLDLFSGINLISALHSDIPTKILRCFWASWAGVQTTALFSQMNLLREVFPNLPYFIRSRSSSLCHSVTLSYLIFFHSIYIKLKLFISLIILKLTTTRGSSERGLCFYYSQLYPKNLEQSLIQKCSFNILGYEWVTIPWDGPAKFSLLFQNGAGATPECKPGAGDGR